MRKKITKITGLVLAGLLSVLLICTLGGCSTKMRDDSELYSCYYYAVDGVEYTDLVVYYTLELRTDGYLITRYKTTKNKDSGRDEYYIEGESLCISSYYGIKKHDMIGNEILLQETVDGERIVAKFRRTATNESRYEDIYACRYYSANGSENTVGDIYYYIVSFGADGEFSIWYRDKTDKLKYTGSYEIQDGGYATTDEDGIERFFRYTDTGLQLEEDSADNTVEARFVKTQTADTATEEK